MTVQVNWVVSAWGLTFQLPQQTVIIRIVSQGVYLPTLAKWLLEFLGIPRNS